MAIEIIGGAERILRLRDVVREKGRIEFGIFPFSRSKCFCKFFTVNADLPRQEAVRVQLDFAKLGYRRLVAAGQGQERKASILVQGDEVVAPLGRVFLESIQRVGYWRLRTAPHCPHKGA